MHKGTGSIQAGDEFAVVRCGLLWFAILRTPPRMANKGRARDVLNGTVRRAERPQRPRDGTRQWKGISLCITRFFNHP